MSDRFNGLGVRIALKDEETFNIVRETLTRIGIASYKKSTLTQSCVIFHKKGQYAILHFKEMLAFDGSTDVIPEEDIMRRNTIVSLLEEWGLIKVLDEDFSKQSSLGMSEIKVISSKEKKDWTLIKKYTIGKNYK